MTFSLLYHLRNYPVRVLLRKPFTRGVSLWKRMRDRKRYCSKEMRSEGAPPELRPFLVSEHLSTKIEGDGIETFLLAYYLEHRFDLLGSGWVKWSYELREEGRGRNADHSSIGLIDEDGEWLSKVVREEHLDRSRRIWKLLEDEDHEAIDWQRDVKSGFRWSAKAWSGDQGKLAAGEKGVDPKLPIELGRMQHLPRMAVFARALKDASPYIREFRSQVLDLIATSPPGMGIQWHYSMDVGIRVANLCLAFDLFLDIDEHGILDDAFSTELARSVLDHGRYIRRNLEYQDGLTGNHYLFNLIGLLFAASYLGPENAEGEEWLKVGIRELIRELFKQFYPDGANFEGSTAYHRLASEAMAWGSALIQGNKERLRRSGWEERVPLSRWSHGISGELHSSAEDPLPQAFIERLWKVRRATETLTKPNGEHPQIGDNDSGRLFRITPVGRFLKKEEYEALYEGIPSYGEWVFDEDQLEQSTLLAAISGLWEEEGEENEGNYIEKELVERFMKGSSLRPPKSRREKTIPVTSWTRGGSYSDLPYQERNKIELGIDLHGAWTLMPNAGWFVHQGAHHYLIINGPPGEGNRHTWGHVHNDRLSFELFLDGKDLFVDPGSYLYGAFPEERNRFRSTVVHNTLYVEGEEQNRWVSGSQGLFYLLPETRCELLSYGSDHMELGLNYRGVHQTRTFRFQEGMLIIEDRSSHPFRTVWNKGDPHSRGYGKKLKSHRS